MGAIPTIGRWISNLVWSEGPHDRCYVSDPYLTTLHRGGVPVALTDGCTDAGNEWKEPARDGLDSQKHTVGCTSLRDGHGFSSQHLWLSRSEGAEQGSFLGVYHICQGLRCPFCMKAGSQLRYRHMYQLPKSPLHPQTSDT